MIARRFTHWLDAIRRSLLAIWISAFIVGVTGWVVAALIFAWAVRSGGLCG